MATRERRSGLYDYLLLVVLLCVIFFNAPGMIVLGYVKANLLPTLDVGQVWTFSILTSLATFVVFYIALRLLNPERSSFKLYLVFCLLCVATCLVLYFGFKVETPWQYLHYYFSNR